MDIPTIPSASNPRRVTFDTLAVWALALTAAVSVLAFIPSATIPFIYSKVSIIAIGALPFQIGASRWGEVSHGRA